MLLLLLMMMMISIDRRRCCGLRDHRDRVWVSSRVFF